MQSVSIQLNSVGIYNFRLSDRHLLMFNPVYVLRMYIVEAHIPEIEDLVVKKISSHTRNMRHEKLNRVDIVGAVRNDWLLDVLHL